MSERSKYFRCTLAACIEPASDECYEELPPHITIAPPFEVQKNNRLELIRRYYDIISCWSSLLYDDDESTLLKLESAKKNFGTDDDPLLVNCVKSKRSEQAQLLLGLREMIKEVTEEVCGEQSTKRWVVGELHVSELEQRLSQIEAGVAINSLTLFIKRNKKWYSNETFFWND